MKTSMTHALVALALSYGLSLFFWLGLGTFNLAGFILVSAGAALAGGLIGWFSKQSILVTAIATIVIRIVLYVVMTGCS